MYIFFTVNSTNYDQNGLQSTTVPEPGATCNLYCNKMVDFNFNARLNGGVLFSHFLIVLKTVY